MQLNNFSELMEARSTLDENHTFAQLKKLSKDFGKVNAEFRDLSEQKDVEEFTSAILTRINFDIQGAAPKNGKRNTVVDKHFTIFNYDSVSCEK